MRTVALRPSALVFVMATGALLTSCLDPKREDTAGSDEQAVFAGSTYRLPDIRKEGKATFPLKCSTSQPDSSSDSETNTGTVTHIGNGYFISAGHIGCNHKGLRPGVDPWLYWLDENQTAGKWVRLSPVFCSMAADFCILNQDSLWQLPYVRLSVRLPEASTSRNLFYVGYPTDRKNEDYSSLPPGWRGPAKVSGRLADILFALEIDYDEPKSNESMLYGPVLANTMSAGVGGFSNSPVFYMNNPYIMVAFQNMYTKLTTAVTFFDQQGRRLSAETQRVVREEQPKVTFYTPQGRQISDYAFNGAVAATQIAAVLMVHPEFEKRVCMAPDFESVYICNKLPRGWRARDLLIARDAKLGIDMRTRALLQAGHVQTLKTVAEAEKIFKAMDEHSTALVQARAKLAGWSCAIMEFASKNEFPLSPAAFDKLKALPIQSGPPCLGFSRPYPPTLEIPLQTRGGEARCGRTCETTQKGSKSKIRCFKILAEGQRLNLERKDSVQMELSGKREGLCVSPEPSRTPVSRGLLCRFGLGCSEEWMAMRILLDKPSGQSCLLSEDDLFGADRLLDCR